MPEKIFRLEQIIKVDRIDGSNLDKLFYLSLFEINHFLQKGFFYSSKEIKSKIRKFLIKFGKKSIIENETSINSAIDSFFLTGKMSNLIISYKLSQKFRKKMGTSYISGHEIDIYFGSRKLNIEIKRCFTTGNVADYIKEEIEKFENFDLSKVKKVLVFFIIICDDESEIIHIMRSVDGYRSLFQYLQEEKIVPNQFAFFIDAFSKNSKIDVLTNDLYSRINKVTLGAY